MAKKRSRSASARYRQRRRPAQPRDSRPRETSSRETAFRETPQASPASQESDLAQEYRYVVRDLKRFAVLAAAMFAVLIILALVLA